MPKPDWQTDEPIFICDAPPGAKWVLRCKKELTAEQYKRIKADFELALLNSNVKVIVLDPNFELQRLEDSYNWPDAEYCAA